MNTSPNVSSNKFHYSFMKILTGSDLSHRRLPVMQVSSGIPEPVVWLTACAHGDEVGGIVIIQEIFKSLRKTPLLRGTLMAFPLMNPIGFETGTRNVPYSKEDLNRSFPGREGGSVAERIAHQIFQTIIQTNPTLVLDLHNDWTDSIPYTLLDPVMENLELSVRLKRFARKTGFPMVLEDADADSIHWKQTLSGSLVSRGVSALTMELGGAYVVYEKNVTLGVKSIRGVLAELGMINEKDPPKPFSLDNSGEKRMLYYTHQPVSSSCGIIRFLVKPGQEVRAGQAVARIYNAFGKLQETLRAGREGIVLGHTDSSVSFPGLPIIAFAVVEKSGR